MTDTKHTPGPWDFILRPSGTIVVLVRDANGNPAKHIAEMSWSDLEGGKDDARLISAAPDLLPALEAVLSSLRAYRKRNTRIAYDIAMQANSAEEAAIAAIAKARGQA